MKQQSRVCFAIMPFGEKRAADGKPIDFDEIYEYIIKEAIESSELKEFDIKSIRCDEISQPGMIHQDMMEHIFEDEVAVVDVTTLNPNVFYELGVRNALCDKITIIVKRKGTTLPFNIKDLRVIDYDLNPKSVKKAKECIIEFIKNGIISGEPDSQVRKWLGERVARGAKSKPLSETRIYEYLLTDLPSKKVCLITGEILGVKVADIWVSSENTNMQMARFFDRSISSAIRYYGARRDDTGDVEEDTIANELKEIMKGRTGAVAPATVIVTGSGMLQSTNNVKKIFHAASVHGQPGKGYTPISDIGACVTNSLKKADSLELENFNLQSILFPLIGTGTARGTLKDKVAELIKEAIAYFESNPNSRLDKIYFLTHTEEQLDTCRSILRERSDIQEATA